MKAPIKWTKMKQIKSPFERNFSLYLNPPIDQTIHVRVPIYIWKIGVLALKMNISNGFLKFLTSEVEVKMEDEVKIEVRF